MSTSIPGSSNSPQAIGPEAVVPVLRLREALAKVRPEAEAIEASDLGTINLDLPGAAITARGCMPELQALRGQIIAKLPQHDLAKFDKVESYGLALIQAHSDYLAASKPPVPVAELTEELKITRELFLSDVTALAKRKLLDGTRLGELQGAYGPKAIATDVLMLCSMLRDSWLAIAGKTAVKVSELDHAEQIADSLTYAIGIREQGPSRASAATLLRQQVYTLFVDAYDQARRAVIYLRWNEGDADSILPSLYAGRKRNGAEEEVAPPPAPGTQPAPVTSQIATPAPAPAPAPANGGAMPVISPFTNT